MNRALIFGIALFLAVVGIALVTVDTSVEAGHKCRCKAKNDCCAPACCAPATCCAPANCCPTNYCPPACCGCHGVGHGVGPAVEAAPAPAAAAAPARAQFGFRTVSFQR